MKRVLVVAAAFVVLTLSPAFAQDEQMRGREFLRASNCIAFSELEALRSDAPQIDRLRALIEEQKAQVGFDARENARVSARDIRRLNTSTEARLQRLRERRDSACAPFVARGLVQMAAAH